MTNSQSSFYRLGMMSLQFTLVVNLLTIYFQFLRNRQSIRQGTPRLTICSGCKRCNVQLTKD